MRRHHDSDFDRALDRLYYEGAVAIPWDQLYLWFNADRLGKGAFREILRRWEELCTITFEYKRVPALKILQPKNWTYPYLLRIIREPFEDEEELKPFESATGEEQAKFRK